MLKLISSREAHDYSVCFVGNLLDTSTNYAVFNPPTKWQGQNRLWVKVPHGVCKLSIDYEGESDFNVDGLSIGPIGRVERLINVTSDTSLAVRVENPTDRSHNVIVGLTKYLDSLSLSRKCFGLLRRAVAAWR